MGLSIRKFLLINLLLAITIIVSLTAIGDYYLDKQDVEDHLDNLLSQAGLSFMVIASHDIQHQNWQKLQQRMYAIPAQNKRYMESRNSKSSDVTGYEGKYRFQIWNPSHVLLLRSSNAPTVMLSNGKEGFNDLIVHNIHYRVFTNNDSETGLTFIVAEPYNERDRLAHHIMENDLYILLLTYPLAGFLIWVIIGRGLRSLDRIREALRHRESRYLEPVNLEGTPIEIQPLILELNKLLFRLKEAFEREKRFASDAAHELRTPLAAIRTQAQVALIVAVSPEQGMVLNNAIMGVDRATHIVNQLLSMSQLVPENEQMKQAEACQLETIIEEVMAQLKPIAESKSIAMVQHLARENRKLVLGNLTALQILVRNLIDNAIRYTPENGKVDITLTADKQNVTLIVADNGPGVPEEFHERIFERFFRMLGTEAPGSGLGLSLVKQIVELHHATIKVFATDPVSHMGLSIKIQFPVYRPTEKRRRYFRES